jgi:hypothetical protein
MRPKFWKHVGVATLVASGLVASGAWPSASRGDEPGRLGRLFRLGGSNSSAPSSPPASRPTARPISPPPYTAPTPPAIASPGSTTTGAGAGSRLIPQPRVNRPVTEADPLLTRVTIGRSDDGNQFGMFLHVFADGTVLDSEGVHRVSPEALRPLTEAIQATETSRPRGHCGGPPTDFIEHVHVVVYDRALGRLRATAFSYSGNPQGCDATVRQLQAAIEAFQAKLGGPTAASATASSTSPAGPSPVPLDPSPIRLTPAP